MSRPRFATDLLHLINRSNVSYWPLAPMAASTAPVRLGGLIRHQCRSAASHRLVGPLDKVAAARDLRLSFIGYRPQPFQRLRENSSSNRDASKTAESNIN